MKNKCSLKYLYKSIFSGTIHNSQIIEITQASVKSWMGKSDEAYLQQWFSHEKESSSNPYFNMQGPWKHVEGKKPTAKDHIFCDSIYVKCPEHGDVPRQEVDEWLPRDERAGE